MILQQKYPKLEKQFLENASLTFDLSGATKAYKATTERIKTKFITTSDLLLQLENADTANKLNDYLKRAIYPNKLLIIDKFGYLITPPTNNLNNQAAYLTLSF